MPLTDTEKERVRYHLGYLAVQPAASLSFGIPRPIQTVFLLETAMNNIIEVSCDRVRSIVRTMECIEQKLTEALDRLAVERIDEITIRDGEPDRLEREYGRWGGRLADMLGVPFYPYSNRFKNVGGVMAGNIPVR